MTALAGALMASGPAATLAVQDAADGSSRELQLSGARRVLVARQCGRRPVPRWRRRPIGKVVIDASRVDYCDGGGIAMLVDLLRQERSVQAPVTVRALRREFQTLLDPRFDPAALRTPAPEHEERLHAVQEIGRAALITWRDIREAGCVRGRDKLRAVVCAAQPAQRALEGYMSTTVNR